jgi:pantoate kinase
MGPQLERVFAVSAAENVSIAKAVDKMDPEKVQTELRAFVDDVADSIDLACGGGDGDVLGRIIGGISG